MDKMSSQCKSAKTGAMASRCACSNRDKRGCDFREEAQLNDILLFPKTEILLCQDFLV